MSRREATTNRLGICLLTRCTVDMNQAREHEQSSTRCSGYGYGEGSESASPHAARLLLLQDVDEWRRQSQRSLDGVEDGRSLNCSAGSAAP